jgi:hypothetical protein
MVEEYCGTAPAPRFWLKALTRKRAALESRRKIGLEEPSWFALLVHDVVHHAVHFLGVSAGMLMRNITIDADHWRNARRQKSEALFLTANARVVRYRRHQNAPFAASVPRNAAV